MAVTIALLSAQIQTEWVAFSKLIHQYNLLFVHNNAAPTEK